MFETYLKISKQVELTNSLVLNLCENVEEQVDKQMLESIQIQTSQIWSQVRGLSVSTGSALRSVMYDPFYIELVNSNKENK
jgi:hypothetical protein